MGWLYYLCFPSWDSKWGVTNLVIKGGCGSDGLRAMVGRIPALTTSPGSLSGHFNAANLFFFLPKGSPLLDLFSTFFFLRLSPEQFCQLCPNKHVSSPETALT